MSATTLGQWLRRDDAPKWTFWLTDFRSTLAYAVSDAGGALARLGRRIHPDVAGDYHDGYAAGEQMSKLMAAARWRAPRPETTRDEARAFLRSLGHVDVDDILDKLDWQDDQA